jgi:hypothetical protein
MKKSHEEGAIRNENNCKKGGSGYAAFIYEKRQYLLKEAIYL